ncbi:MAG: NAD-dependent epimerase/dehydratase family protein [Bacteroidetes bacterium]|nr:NAD-dependent epimerase/dehydratase family protein [Bacteroidota bacterium]
MSKGDTILVLGAAGQNGTDLVTTLRETHGGSRVIATDVKEQAGYLSESGPFYTLDVLDAQAIADIIRSNKVKEVYLLAALLNATAEQKMKAAWRLNMEGLFILLDLAKELGGLKIFWPSSIAVFGPTTPRNQTPQYTVMEPSTVYGISKQAGERWCEYYFNKFGVDVRSIRYPGLISYKALPGGGTTDYAVDIYHQALDNGHYNCFLKEDTALPMMYMPDAIRATLELMAAPAEKVKIRSSYNLGGISFTPKEIAAEIAKHVPGFTIDYTPDFRQQIADSWPNSIDDSRAQQDWGWQCKYDLSSMTIDMLSHLKNAREITE